jgi:hypothetical protein
MDSFAQQVSGHSDLLKWILNRYKIMDKISAGLQLSNQETKQSCDNVLESKEKLVTRCADLI